MNTYANYVNYSMIEICTNPSKSWTCVACVCLFETYALTVGNDWDFTW